jgi:hypothetical protein
MRYVASIALTIRNLHANPLIPICAFSCMTPDLWQHKQHSYKKHQESGLSTTMSQST